MCATDGELQREFLRLIDAHLCNYDSLFWLVDIIEYGEELGLGQEAAQRLMLALIEGGFVEVASGADGTVDFSFEFAVVVMLTDKGRELIGKLAPIDVSELIREIEEYLGRW